jgi:serine/threonine protein phosphatase PrpC
MRNSTLNYCFFEFFESEHYQGFRFLKSKKDSVCGDNNLIKDTEHFSYIINCDGVSSSASPEKSASILIDTFENHFKSTTSKKPRLGKITEILTKKNKEYLKKDLATTFDLFVFSKKFNYYIGLGDSSFYIFNEDNEVVFQNWIHNQSKIIEDHFGTVLGADNVLVNCIGITHPRFEMTENIKMLKNSKIIFHSDGIEQFFDSPKKIYNYCTKIFDQKNEDSVVIQNQMNEYFLNNDDDLSLVFCIIK